jgi:hypothetical protein
MNAILPFFNAHKTLILALVAGAIAFSNGMGWTHIDPAVITGGLAAAVALAPHSAAVQTEQRALRGLRTRNRNAQSFNAQPKTPK